MSKTDMIDIFIKTIIIKTIIIKYTYLLKPFDKKLN